MRAITCGQVQEYLYNYYRDNGEKLSFYEAYMQMTKKGIRGKFEKLKSFLEWDINKISEFQDFHNKLPVET